MAPSCPIPTVSARLWEPLRELVAQLWSFLLGLRVRGSFQLASVTTVSLGKQIPTHRSRSASDTLFPEALGRRCPSGSIPRPLWSRLSRQREVSRRALSSSFPWLKSQKERRVRGSVARRVKHCVVLGFLKLRLQAPA